MARERGRCRVRSAALTDSEPVTGHGLSAIPSKKVEFFQEHVRRLVRRHRAKAHVLRGGARPAQDLGGLLLAEPGKLRCLQPGCHAVGAFDRAGDWLGKRGWQSKSNVNGH